MHTYILADYLAYTGENEIHVLKGDDIVSVLYDYCEENEIFFFYDSNDLNDLDSILYSINTQTNSCINIIQLDI